MTVFNICKIHLCCTVYQYFISFCYWNNFITYYYFSIVWIYLILYVHSSFAENLNCSIFWLLWTFMCRFLCEHMFSLFLGIHIREESLGRMVTLCKWWILDCFPQWLQHFTFPPAVLSRGSNFSIFSSTCIWIFFFFFPSALLVCVQFSSVAQFSSVQSLSRVRLFATPWIAAHQASLSITNSQNSLRLTSIESVMPSSHLILCCPLLLLPPIPPSIRIFSNESTLRMRWPKYWSFSFSIIPSREHPGLISFRMDWLDLLAVQGTLKSLLQHHSLKISILWHSAFFIVQLSHPYMTTGKIIALTRRNLCWQSNVSAFEYAI